MVSSSCSDLISLGKAGICSSPSKGASKRSDSLILFSIVFSLSGDIAHSPACFNFDSILSSLQRTKTKNKTFEGQIINIFKDKM